LASFADCKHAGFAIRMVARTPLRGVGWKRFGSLGPHVWSAWRVPLGSARRQRPAGGDEREGRRLDGRSRVATPEMTQPGRILEAVPDNDPRSTTPVPGPRIVEPRAGRGRGAWGSGGVGGSAD
jgi:hypothetical protein